MKILGESVNTPEESYVYTGGTSRIRIYMRIVSVAFLGVAFFYVAGRVLVFFCRLRPHFCLNRDSGWRAYNLSSTRQRCRPFC